MELGEGVMGRDGRQGYIHCQPESGEGSPLDRAQQLFNHRPGLLDRVEVRRVGGR
jgi:hypothetical protein